MSNKRKHKTLHLKDKLDIIKKLDSGENICKLAKEYGIGRTTVHDLKKKRQKILDHVKTMGVEAGKRKILRAGACPKMEKALYTWFKQHHSKHTPITGENLKEKAIEFYRKITNKYDFRASDGWLDNFKKRFGIRLLNVSDDKFSSDEPAEQPFFQNLIEKIEDLGLVPDQIYTASGSDLFWKLLPNKIFVSSKERGRPALKESKDIIKFMPCSNASGTHKLDLLVIGKDKNPSTFKNICMPVCYKKQFKNLITSKVFSAWFHNDFVPEVYKFMTKSNLPVRALLVLENTIGYPYEQEIKSSDGNIETIFLPPNSTPLIQPINQNVIQRIHCSYKNKLLIHIISQDGDIAQIIEEFNLKDAVFSLAQAWESISPDLIQSSLRELWPTMNAVSVMEHFEPEDNIPTAYWLENLSKRGLETSKEKLNSWFEGIVTPEEICEAVMEEDMEPSTKIKTETVFNCFNTCITWAEENGISAKDIILLRNMREKAFIQGLQGGPRQTSIKDYFKTI
ncbi:jerky protein homolog-like [Colias croceus]|uniref:jerky protein homolog-like n=1 Tax=Colias crocea TaxID=72248 RepID=UPI001E27E9CD|nr:jerky protein homolog-like [Colias croceus]